MTAHRTISDDLAPLYVGWDEWAHSYWADAEPFASKKQRELLLRARRDYRKSDPNVTQLGARSEWISERGHIDTVADLMVQTWDVVPWAANAELLSELLFDTLEAHRTRLYWAAYDDPQITEVDLGLGGFVREVLEGWTDEELWYPYDGVEIIELPDNQQLFFTWSVPLETYNIQLFEVLPTDNPDLAWHLVNRRLVHEVGDVHMQVSNLTDLAFLMVNVVNWYEHRDVLIALRDLPLRERARSLWVANGTEPDDLPELRALLDPVLESWYEHHQW